MMLASLTRPGENQQYLVLNDVVFLREPTEALVTLQIKLSVNQYPVLLRWLNYCYSHRFDSLFFVGRRSSGQP